MLSALGLFAVVAIAAPEPRPSNSPPSNTAVAKEPSQARPSNQGSETGYNQQGTERNPLVVKVAPAPKGEAEATQDAEDRKQKSASDWWTVRLAGAAVIVGVAQGWVFYIQARRLKQTIDTMQAISQDQSSDVHKSITQATRAAAAMEGVSGAMAQNVVHMGELMVMQREFWQKQMRAYVSVIVGGATYQEREKNLRFEASPALVNTGLTPAHDVVYEIKSDVLPIPLSDSHDFTLSPQDALGGAVVGPHQNRIMSGCVDQIYFDQEVEDIKTGKGKALCVWGTVHYKDVFGSQHFTNFCQVLTWTPGNRVVGYYHKAHNDSD